MSFYSYLDHPLIYLISNNGDSTFTIGDSFEGVQIFGGIGSGKTSGSGQLFALKYLQCDYGGLVLCAKTEEKDLWIDYCKRTNRLDDLVIVEPKGKHSFDLMAYLSNKTVTGLSVTQNILQVLKTVLRASEEKSGGMNDDPFWEKSLDMLLVHVIELCLLVYKEVSIEKLYNIVNTIPKKDAIVDNEPVPGSFHDVFGKARKILDDQLSKFSFARKARIAKMKDKQAYYRKYIKHWDLVKRLDNFFSDTYFNISDKTRSIIDIIFTGFLFNLTQEPLKSLFCSSTTTFTPDLCRQGKIIILNIPVKKYHNAGRDAQILFKYIWQRCMEEEDVGEEDHPVFLFSDEAQHFLHEHDAEYQATARSKGIATVYISQNIPNYHANMGGIKSEYRVKGFLGTLGTKIFHANADIETNRYASELLGEGYSEEIGYSSTISGNFSSNKSRSIKLERVLRPEEFGRLRTGGKRNNLFVEAIMHQQGRIFPNGFNHQKITFHQTPIIE